MRRMILLPTLVVVACQFAPLTAAHSQQQPTATDGGHRNGGWFGIGVTVGWLSESDIIDDGGTSTLNVRAGGTISPHFRLGGELDLGFCHQDPLAALLLVGTVYPVARADFFLKLGMGARVLADLEYVYIPLDLIGVVGVGYDLRPSSERFSLTPFLQLAIGPTILSFEDRVRETVRRHWQFGLSFTWH